MSLPFDDVLKFDDNDVDCERFGDIFEGVGRGISKISTTSEYPLEFCPPPKNILFVDDADARSSRG
jgi:hypothetical protein